MKPLVIIPARGGSKGVPGKNKNLLGGKPLISYTIEAAMENFDASQIIVSTDDIEIAEIARKHGLSVPELRPVHLASDTATTADLVDYLVEQAEAQEQNFDTIILLQPTSPFRNSTHIREAVALFEKKEAEMVVSVKITDSNPYYVLKEEDENGFLVSSKSGNFTRRQDCPVVYELNGAIYIIDKKIFKKDKFNNPKMMKYVMEAIDSIDIDTPLDWKFAELIMNSKL